MNKYEYLLCYTDGVGPDDTPSTYKYWCGKSVCTTECPKEESPLFHTVNTIAGHTQEGWVVVNQSLKEVNYNIGSVWLLRRKFKHNRSVLQHSEWLEHEKEKHNIEKSVRSQIMRDVVLPANQIVKRTISPNPKTYCPNA